MIAPKDLTREPPRSPRKRVGGYAILGRTIDKCAATLAGTAGDFHFDCPLDNLLFDFKKIRGDDFKAKVAAASEDADIVAWLLQAGEPRTEQDIRQWSSRMEAENPVNDPEKGEWFKGECEALGLDPGKTSLFDYLEADDDILRHSPAES